VSFAVVLSHSHTYVHSSVTVAVIIVLEHNNQRQDGKLCSLTVSIHTYFKVIMK
jgi:D-hexose-6-phosphate mutarotase